MTITIESLQVDNVTFRKFHICTQIVNLFVSFCEHRMRYVAAYLLAVLGGNTSPSSKDIKDILGSVGIEAEDERLNKVPHLTPYSAISKALDIFSAEVESSFSLQVISELNGKDINEVMNSGKVLLIENASTHSRGCMWGKVLK